MPSDVKAQLLLAVVLSFQLQVAVSGGFFETLIQSQLNSQKDNFTASMQTAAPDPYELKGGVTGKTAQFCVLRAPYPPWSKKPLPLCKCSTSADFEVGLKGVSGLATVRVTNFTNVTLGEGFGPFKPSGTNFTVRVEADLAVGDLTIHAGDVGASAHACNLHAKAGGKVSTQLMVRKVHVTVNAIGHIQGSGLFGRSVCFNITDTDAKLDGMMFHNSKVQMRILGIPIGAQIADRLFKHSEKLDEKVRNAAQEGFGNAVRKAEKAGKFPCMPMKPWADLQEAADAVIV